MLNALETPIREAQLLPRNFNPHPYLSYDTTSTPTSYYNNIPRAQSTSLNNAIFDSDFVTPRSIHRSPATSGNGIHRWIDRISRQSLITDFGLLHFCFRFLFFFFFQIAQQPRASLVSRPCEQCAQSKSCSTKITSSSVCNAEIAFELWTQSKCGRRKRIWRCKWFECNLYRSILIAGWNNHVLIDQLNDFDLRWVAVGFYHLLSMFVFVVCVDLCLPVGIEHHEALCLFVYGTWFAVGRWFLTLAATEERCGARHI